MPYALISVICSDMITMGKLVCLAAAAGEIFMKVQCLCFGSGLRFKIGIASAVNAFSKI